MLMPNLANYVLCWANSIGTQKIVSRKYFIVTRETHSNASTGRTSRVSTLIVCSRCWLEKCMYGESSRAYDRQVRLGIKGSWNLILIITVHSLKHETRIYSNGLDFIIYKNCKSDSHPTQRSSRRKGSSACASPCWCAHSTTCLWNWNIVIIN